MKRSPSALVNEPSTSRTPARGGVRRHASHTLAQNDPESIEAPRSAMKPRGRGSEREQGQRGEASPRMLARVKEAVLHLLSHHERLLLVLWYVERMTVAEIARTLNLTEQQADRMHADVLTKLRLGA